MSSIRYVCLSDLHLGEEDSLLTNITPAGEVDTTLPSPVLARLALCLAEILRRAGSDSKKPALVLNGDVLELALADMDKAAIAFAQLLSLVMPENGELFDEIIFLPGNHDHHLWEMARETQYLKYMSRLEKITSLEAPWHTTKVFMDMQGEDRLASGFLTAVARRFEHLRTRQAEVLTAYPNFGVLEGSDRCVIFHHGHFVEPLYRLMSTATSLVFDHPELPADVYALEAENFAWIDFFWSAMGRSGEAGEEVESIYEATNDARSLQAITDSLAANVAKRYRLPVLRFDWLEERVLRKLLRRCVVRRVAAKQERQRSGDGRTEMPLSAGAIEGLRQYLEVMLRGQVEIEHGPMPERVTYVFGHTHKPFEQAMQFKGYSEGVRVLNTGGWVVDTVERDPLHGGAVVVIDEDLNAVNLRIFNEGRYRARVEEPLRPGEAHSALYLEVSQIVDTDREPWRSLGETIDREVETRAELLKSRISRRRDDGSGTP